MGVADYKDLIAWQKSMDLVESVYRVTRAFPREELYCLTNQVRRAAISVPSNIAEGQGRGIGHEFAHHIRIANSSRQEAETQILLAERLEYIDANECGELLTQFAEVGRLIVGLHRSVLPDA